MADPLAGARGGRLMEDKTMLTESQIADAKADLAFHEQQAAEIRKCLGIADPAAELLTACEEAVRRLSSTRFSTAADDDIVTRLIAAIAKTKGKS